MAADTVIYFDTVNTFGVTDDGVIFMTLTMDVPATDQNGKTARGVLPVAHVRIGKRALLQLKEAVDKIALGVGCSGTRN
jgi:hypothetical protein